MSRLTHRTAKPEDFAHLFSLMREFYEEEQLVFDPMQAERALKVLLGQPEWGCVLLLGDEEVPEKGPEGSGFMVLLRGFTLEHGGVYVLLDELYLHPTLRGRGLGKAALQLADEWARAQGVSALRLEVNHHNPAAKALYAKAGFRDEHRDLMFRSLRPD